MVTVSPSALVVCVEDEARGGGVGSRPSADKIADTVFAAPSAAASVENCDGFLRQFSLVCRPSKGLFGNDEDGR